jgi:hypothetical protein
MPVTRALGLALLFACSSAPPVSDDPDAGGQASQCVGENDVCAPPDAGTPDAGDAGEPDAGSEPDAGGPPCDPDTPETFAEACGRYGFDCGTPTIVDRCGVTREVDCGHCAGIGQCGAQHPNVCYCVPSTSEERCAAQARVCGHTDNVDDNCGHPVVDDCGACPDGKRCNPAGTHCL